MQRVAKSNASLVILGAGPAGAAAAYATSATRNWRVTLVEAQTRVGGNASSFTLEGVYCDFGSHRLHPQADPRILEDLSQLLGDDLMLRPRHGRIRLGGRWVHFPLKPLDALLNLPVRFTVALAKDMLLKRFKARPKVQTFASVLYSGLGRTISENFYFPYVSKLWGRDPEELAVTLAQRRVASGSVLKILAKMLRMIPGLRGPTTGKFFYPARGFGQITESLVSAACAQGVELCLETSVSGIEHDSGTVTGVRFTSETQHRRVDNPILLSTIPLTALVHIMDPPPPEEVVRAANAIKFRGMILVYLVLETDQFSEFDAHYFPELSIPISRMSEPKNYSATREPHGLTILCAELPADPGDEWWSKEDAEFLHLMPAWLESVGLSVNCPVRKCHTRRLAHAYPVYSVGYEKQLSVIDDWFSSIDGLLVFGRQGLFAHDNTHHAMAMAYAVDDCLGDDGVFDEVKWSAYRESFLKHTVED